MLMTYLIIRHQHDLKSILGEIEAHQWRIDTRIVLEPNQFQIMALNDRYVDQNQVIRWMLQDAKIPGLKRNIGHFGTKSKLTRLASSKAAWGIPSLPYVPGPDFAADRKTENFRLTGNSTETMIVDEFVQTCMKALWPWKDRSLRTISYVKWCSFVFIFGYYFSARRSVIVTSVAEIWKCVALGVMGQNTWEIRRIFIRIFLVACCIPYSPIPARVRVRILSPEVRGPNRGTGRPGPIEPWSESLVILPLPVFYFSAFFQLFS